ncbi:MAG TPA: hypothetical protein DCX06_00560 [Opitutae bacterium]|nr:hypothetical protein [Opitutae bacterium]
MPLATYGIEAVLSLIVLKVAFHLTGFPALNRHLVPISLLVAFSTLLVDSYIGENAFFIRNIVALAVTYNLIRWITDAKDWELAMTIALVARVVTVIIFWATYTFNLVYFERL